MDKKREKLIDKLVKLGVFTARNHAECVADFIIEDRKRIVNKVWKGSETLRKLKLAIGEDTEGEKLNNIYRT